MTDRPAPQCETPKSPPGDYNLIQRPSPPTSHPACETPKSPPGDYNFPGDAFAGRPIRQCVKHLNPRQGITTKIPGQALSKTRLHACETPKSPPGDYNTRSSFAVSQTITYSCETPKSPPGDYNLPLSALAPARLRFCVKHLNPRQGITTRLYRPRLAYHCESCV